MRKQKCCKSYLALILGCILVAVLFASCGSKTLNEAQKAFDAGEYENAIGIINDSEESIDDNEDLKSLYVSCYEKWANELMSSNDYQKTIEVLEDSGIDLSDGSNLASTYSEAWNKLADQKIAEKDYYQAFGLLSKMIDSGVAPTEGSEEKFYQIGEGLSKNKQFAPAALAYAKAGGYKDSDKKCKTSWDKGAFRKTAALDDYTSIGIRADGTVASAINTELIDSVENVSMREARAKTTIDTDGWKDMISVECNEYYYVGLTEGGTIKVGETGFRDMSVEGSIDAEDWNDIVSIALDDGTLIGLTKDGRVKASGEYESDFSEVSSWNNIVQVSINYNIVTGVDASGNVHVVNAGAKGDSYDPEDTFDNPYEEKELQDKSISQFTANSHYGVYVTKSGELKTTVTEDRAERTTFNTAIGTDEQMELKDYSGFDNSDFVSCDASYDYYMGLRKDGSVRAGGYMGSIFENALGVKDLKDLKEAHLGMGGNPVVYGVTEDGTFKMAGYDGGLYIPYHNRIKGWGKLRKPTRVYDTSGFN